MNRDWSGQDGRPSLKARTPPAAILLVLALLLGKIGCAPGDAASRDRAEGLISSEPRALHPPAGRASAVQAISWGGAPDDRRLGALFEDGRIAVYRPAIGQAPVSVGLVVPERGPLSGVAVSASDRVVTGDSSGLMLWDTTDPMARPIDSFDCGAVGALAIDPIGPNDLLVGLEDGRLLRFRPARDRIGPPRAEDRSTGRASGVRSFNFIDNGRSVIIIRDDGNGERRERQLAGPSEPIGPAQSVAEVRDWIIRILGPEGEGPVLEATGANGVPAWRFPLPADGVELSAVLGGDGLIVGCVGRVLLMRPSQDGPPRPAEVRGLPAEGATRIAVDPAGRRVALADGAGRLIVYDAEELARSALTISLDNAADLAFRPQRRAYHPRAGYGQDATTALTSKRLANRIDEGRRLLDRGEFDTLRSFVRDLEADPALDREASADVATLIAAVRQETGWPDTTIRHPLGVARATFSSRGWLDREADLRLWSGSLLIPSFDGRVNVSDAVRIEEALAEFRRASGLYRQVGPSLERQAQIAEAMTAWGLLSLGRPQSAQTVFSSVEHSVRHDPVLRQAPEFDRIAAALAVARRDWESADLASHRLLRRLSPPPPDRQLMAREAAMERVGNLAALGRWSEAALVLDIDRPDDPEWSLRRATVRFRAGFDMEATEPAPIDPSAEISEKAVNAHIRGRFAVLSNATRAEGADFLLQAAEAHRRSGRSDLAIEADLERAEALERLERLSEAIELYAQAVRALVAETNQARIRGAARPIRFATGRAYRGLARCQLGIGQPAHALGAVDQAALASWFERSGEARVRSSALVSPPGGATALSLKNARREAVGAPRSAAADSDPDALIRQLEARLVAEHRELALTDPTRPFDPSSLRLSANEAVLVVAGVGPESLSGFLIRPGLPILAQTLPIRRSELRRAARLWRSALGDGGRPCELETSSGPEGLLAIASEPEVIGIDLSRSFDHSPSRLIVETVLGPFLEALDDVSLLFVVPDDALSALPIDALVAGPDEPELPSIRYVPNLSLFKQYRSGHHTRNSEDRSVLIASAGEPTTALAVRSAYGPEGIRVEVSDDPVEIKSRLLGSEPIPAVLHLESVALLDPAASSRGEPELLLGSDASAGVDSDLLRLSGSDLLGLNLEGANVLLWLDHQPKPSVADPTSWRELAACWLAAGADAVVMCLWEPPADSSPVFAAELHQGLSQNLSLAEALDRARRTLAGRPSTADPVHWAGFVLYELGPRGRSSNASLDDD